MKKKLSRRFFLRGAGGAVVALPFLDAMLSSRRTNAQPREVPKRVIFMFTPNGVVPEHFFPTGGERDFTIGESLVSLEPLRDKLVFLDGIRMDTAPNDGETGNGHDRGTAHVLTATECVPGPMGRGQFGHLWDGSAGGISIDQHIANAIGGDTTFRSLEFGVKADGIRQALPSRISYTGAFEPLIPMSSPTAAYDRILRPLSGSADESARAQRERELVLSYVGADLSRVRSRVGSEDRERIDAHIDSIESVQRQLRELAASSCEVPGAPEETNDYEAIGRVQMDLMATALKCDLTRVMTLQWSNGQSGVRLPGYMDGHHPISHEESDARPSWDSSVTYRQLAQSYDIFYAEQFAYLLQSLDSVIEADGQTLLDHTAIVWVNEQSWGTGNRHSWERMPFVLGGSLGGAFSTGRYLQADAPHANLYVEIMQALGMPDTTFGQAEYCTGGLPSLT